MRDPLNLTIVMYHYIRPIEGSEYSGIKGLEMESFHKQLDFIECRYQTISVKQVIDAASGGRPLPSNAILLTFDDGFSDHYHNVFPLLINRSMTGVFFPPACSVLEGRILDVHKIHFLLAKAGNVSTLIQFIENAVVTEKKELSLESLEYYREAWYRPTRFDTAEVIFIKRMLQTALPEEFRSALVQELFSDLVSADEKDFASSLYCSFAELSEMVGAGMTIGGHGYNHNWLNSLSVDKQAEEIDRSQLMLASMGADQPHFVFSYPYGGYNENTLNLLEERGCDAAFTTQVSRAAINPRMNKSSLLQLPRIDTNDLQLLVDQKSEPRSFEV